jgi:hypothetical protein
MRLCEVLGEAACGGMRTARRVRDPELRRELALTAFWLELRKQPALVQRFLAEPRALAAAPAASAPN